MRKSMKKATAEVSNSIQTSVKNAEVVASFLDDLARQAAVSNVSAEVVKSSLLVRAFLLEHVASIKSQNPGLFEAKDS